MSSDRLSIEWFRANDFNSKTGNKSDKALIKFNSNKVSFNGCSIKLIDWKEGNLIAFGQDVKTNRIFITKGGKGFKLRNGGKDNSYLTFTNKALFEKMLGYYNQEKKRTVSTGYEPSERAVFLVVALEEQKGVFELLPIL